MPKSHDTSGSRLTRDTPPPSYQDIVDIDIRPLVHGENPFIIEGCLDNEANSFSHLEMDKERSKSDCSTSIIVCAGDREGDDMPNSFKSNSADNPIGFSGSFMGSNEYGTGDRHNPLLRQPAYDLETRRPSEVRRCMALYKILSRELSEDDLEVDGDIGASRLDNADDLDIVDGCDVEDCADDDCTNLITFIKTFHEESRSMIASYLSSGKLSDIVLTHENYHLFLHVSISLNLRQLKAHCITYYFEREQSANIVIRGNCTCSFAIEHEVQKGYQRSDSVISENDDYSPPEYFIAFSKSQKALDKVCVVVINMGDKMKVLQRIIEKPLGNEFACCSVEQNESPFIFVSGGENKSFNQVWKYDVLEGRWSKQAKLLHGRSSHIMTVCNGVLYVLGGKEFPCIEEYDAKGKKWRDRASLATPVYSAVSAVHCKNIYVFGGLTPAGPVSAVQCFDTLTNRIKRLQDLPCPISAGQAAVINDNIYIASGQGHMIVYETACGISKLCAEQPVMRENFGMFVKNERVYLVGGVVFDGEHTNNKSQYRYNPEKDCWVEKEKLDLSLPVYASCIIRYPKKCPVIPFDYL